MKKIRYSPGGQPFRNSDFQLQQEEIYKAIHANLESLEGCIVSGCVLTGTSLSAGYVHLDGKILPLAAATGLSFPCYIRQAAPVDFDVRQFSEDLQNKATKTEEKAEIVTTIPSSGQFITITAAGADRRLSLIRRNEQNGQFTPDGFALNAGKVSHVIASSSLLSNISTSITPFTSYSEVVDELNEFNATSGEFTAQSSGLYLVAGAGRLTYASSSVADRRAEIAIQRFSGGSWVSQVSYAQEAPSDFFGSTFAIAMSFRLVAGERIRLIARRLGAATGINAIVSTLNITKIS